MVKDKVALVVQGGGARGIFGAGVTDALFDAGLEFPYIVGTSSGCLISFNLVSRDRGRAKTIIVKGMPDKRFASFSNLVKKGSFFDFDFLFKVAPIEVCPFDQKTFDESKVKFFCGCTGVEDGLPHYFEKSHPEFLAAAGGSSSLPFLGKPVKVEECHYMDGGTTCPIPFHKALDDGCEKIVVVLTRPRLYRKGKSKPLHRLLYRLFYHKYPNYLKALQKGHDFYNSEMDTLFKLEKEGKAFLIFCPEGETIKRTEKKEEVLNKFYQSGYEVGRGLVPALNEFLTK